MFYNVHFKLKHFYSLYQTIHRTIKPFVEFLFIIKIKYVILVLKSRNESMRELYKKLSNIIAASIIVSTFSIPICLIAKGGGNGVYIGSTLSIHSKVLDEDRNILIYLPNNYDLTDEKYPVIYVLDGSGNFIFSSSVVNFLSRIGHIPRSIVVGIPNTNRGRDFTPTSVKEIKASGGANKFLKFMQSELQPYIDNNFRTQSYKTLFGHSLCGMFAIYTLFEEPNLFNSYISVSPYLQFDNQVVIEGIGLKLTKNSDYNECIYIAVGNEPDYVESIEKLENLLKQNPNKLDLEIDVREEEDHNSILLKSFYNGLEYIYSTWRLPDEAIHNGVEGVIDHYSRLSKKYGYEIRPTEFNINIIGYNFLQQEEYSKAIDFFSYNVDLYPKSANVYDSLGEAQETMGEIESASKNYEKAVEIGTMNNDPNLGVYKNNLNRVLELK